jgi:hypothetical protein
VPPRLRGGQRIRRLLEKPRPVTAARRVAGFTVTVLTAPALALAVPVWVLLNAPRYLDHPADQPPVASAPHFFRASALPPGTELN